MAGKFEWLKIIGSGTYGDAWLARCQSSKTKCVIKVIRILKLSEKELDQCLTEVSILARFSHRNIVKYLDAFVGDGALNIVMELADGGDLHRKIVEQKGIHFGKEVILDWFVQMCLALTYIHQQNILHRDLKSQNIFLTTGSVIKVGDFGIARILRDSEDHAITAVGTPFYISPEICQRKPYNFKSDMWAAGCVLYELCCLHVPFNARDFEQLTLKILQGDYEPLPRYLGSTLQYLVTKLLDVDPAKRLSSEEILSLPDLKTYVRRHADKRLDQGSFGKGRDVPKVSSSSKDDRVPGEDKDVPNNYSDNKVPVSVQNENSDEMKYKGARPKRTESKENHLEKEDVKRSKTNEEDRKDSHEGVEVTKLKNAVIGKTYKVKNPKFRRLSLATPRIQGIVARQRATLSADYDKKSIDIEDNPKQKLFENLQKRRNQSNPTQRNPSEMSNNEDDVFMHEVLPSSGKDVNNNEREVTDAAVLKDCKKEFNALSGSENSKTYSVVKPKVVTGSTPADLTQVKDVAMFTAKTLYNATIESEKDVRTASDNVYMKLIKLVGQKRFKYLMQNLSESLKKKKDFSTVKDLLSEEELLLFPLIIQYHCLSILPRHSVPG